MPETCSSVALSRGGHVTMIVDAAAGAVKGEAPVLVLAHGAGNDARSSFLEYFATALPAAGLVVVRFNFPYKERTGTRPPDKMDVLMDTMQDVIATQARMTGAPPGPLFIGGKSMGSRVATALAAAGRVKPAGIVCLGYPLHKPGEPSTERAADLAKVRAPILFLQGTRDPFCDLGLLRGVRKSAKLAGSLVEIDGGDHSYLLPASRRKEQAAAMETAAGTILRFVQKVADRRAT